MKVGLSLLIGDLKCSPIDGVVALPNICLDIQSLILVHYNMR